MRPFYQRLELGSDPRDAYRDTWPDIMKNIEFRTWYRGQALGDAGEDEVVLVNTMTQDLQNPYRAILANERHDLRLRAWARSDDHQK